MIGLIVAVLLAALAYVLCSALGLPTVVALVAAIVVLVVAVPSGGYGAGGRWGGRSRP